LLVSLTPTAIAYCTPAIAAAVEPLPLALRNLMATIFACQFTPTTPTLLLPTPAMVPDTCEPCPLSSKGSPSSFAKS